MERVAKENREMLKRLEQVEPIYKVSDWVDDWRRTQELTEMITAYPMEFQPSTPMVSLVSNNVLMVFIFINFLDHNLSR